VITDAFWPIWCCPTEYQHIKIRHVPEPRSNRFAKEICVIGLLYQPLGWSYERVFLRKYRPLEQIYTACSREAKVVWIQALEWSILITFVSFYVNVFLGARGRASRPFRVSFKSPDRPSAGRVLQISRRRYKKCTVRCCEPRASSSC
jgi:hypothetical protein